MMNTIRRNIYSKGGFAWLEVILAIAILSLLFQVFPSLWLAIDFRNWSRMTALVVNILALFVLVAIKASPNVIADFRERQKRSKTARDEKEKSQMRKEQIEAIERMQESRRRRKF